MLFSSFVTISLFVSYIHYVGSLKLTTIVPKAFANPSPNVISSKVLEMTKSNVPTQSFKGLQIIRTHYGNTTLTALEGGQSYSVPIQYGPQSFNAILDSGSSDTWVPASNFQCLELPSGLPAGQAECAFGALYYIDSTWSEIPNENFDITYGDQEFATGCMGYESVTLAGITVTRQEIALVNVTAWEGDGFSSGLVGLAYPALTSAFPGSNLEADNVTDSLTYNPVFTNMYQQQQVAPVFSIAINRGTIQGPSGYFAIGGLPPVNVTGVYASAPIQILSVEGENLPKALTFYTITPDGFVYGNESSAMHAVEGENGPQIHPVAPAPAAPFQVVIDSGTTLNYLPAALCAEINNLFDPPAIFSPAEGAWIVDCNATAPAFGVKIDGTNFNVKSLDLILDDGSGTDTCVSGINSAALSGINILGDVFLKNVVAIFDVGAGEMRFAAREDY